MVARTDRSSTTLRAPRLRTAFSRVRSRASRLLVVVAILTLTVGGPAASPARAVTYLYLTISLAGNGSGAWQSQDGQIDCRMVNGYVDPREPCSGQYAVGPSGSVTVHYSITPAAGSCVVIVNCPADGGAVVGASTTFTNDLTKSALINLQPLQAVAVTKSGAGTGSVSSSPGGISCGSACAYYVPRGTIVTLTATPSTGSTFAGWSGPCSGQDETCQLTISGQTSTDATFGLAPVPTPSPSVGTVPTASPLATAHATPKASSKPLSTTQPGSTAGPAAATPEATQPGGTNDVPSFEVPTLAPPTGAAPSLPAATPDTSPTATGGSDLTPIALAILGAGLLIALGIGAAAYLLRKRPASPPG